LYVYVCVLLFSVGSVTAPQSEHRHPGWWLPRLALPWKPSLRINELAEPANL
jgi:hypothetical protein